MQHETGTGEDAGKVMAHSEPQNLSPLRISVVIPHLNQHDMLAHCLNSLMAGTRAADEITVVDNGSYALPEAVCADYPGVRLLREKTPGPGPARNCGVAASTGDILAFIDADCIAAPDWLAAGAAAMADPDTAILGGDVRIAYANPGRLTMLEAYESIYAYRMDRYIAREGFTGTGNLLVRRGVMEDVGPFAGIGVAEDRDWGRRATAKGYRIRYVAGMRVYHPARTDFDGLRQKWSRQSSHDYTEGKVRPYWRLRWIAKMLAMGISPLAEIPRIMMSDRVSGLRSRLLAFACLCRIRAYRARIMIWLGLGGDPAKLAGQWNRTAEQKP
jgi:glycosyltransferase involved in cell wall biosynthesis